MSDEYKRPMLARRQDLVIITCSLTVTTNANLPSLYASWQEFVLSLWDDFVCAQTHNLSP